jgi:hypothetical protein
MTMEVMSPEDNIFSHLTVCVTRNAFNKSEACDLNNIMASTVQRFGGTLDYKITGYYPLITMETPTLINLYYDLFANKVTWSIYEFEE